MNDVILLIPHYNNVEGLKKSLSSIGEKENIDVLIVDDGSKFLFDEKSIESNFQAKGDVFFMYLTSNQGIEIALNTGLKSILEKGYTYTARLDCGDICVDDRFIKQEVFLKTNQEIHLVGSNVEFLDVNGVLLYALQVPKRDKDIRKKMYINAMHIHPTIMFKNKMLETTGLYPTKYKAAEDYAFFFKVINKFLVANIDEVLVKCELNPKGISSRYRKQQAKNRIKIILDNFYVGFYPIYGLFRSIILYILPLKLLINLKRILHKCF